MSTISAYFDNTYAEQCYNNLIGVGGGRGEKKIDISQDSIIISMYHNTGAIAQQLYQGFYCY